MTLEQAANSGVLGRVSPGQHFLGRFLNRIVWFQVVHSGLGYVRVVIKVTNGVFHKEIHS